MLYIQLTVHYSCAISHKFCRVTQIEIVFQRKPFLNEMNICNDVLIVINSKLSRCWIVRLYESGWIKFTFIVKLLVSNSWMMPANTVTMVNRTCLKLVQAIVLDNITPCHTISPIATFYHHERWRFIIWKGHYLLQMFLNHSYISNSHESVIWSNIENRFQN